MYINSAVKLLSKIVLTHTETQDYQNDRLMASHHKKVEIRYFNPSLICS